MLHFTLLSGQVKKQHKKTGKNTCFFMANIF
jgi:hypothetical protein